MSVKKELFGKTREGNEVFRYVLENQSGMKAVVSEFGAVLLELWVPDQEGTLRDVVLGYEKLEDYFENAPGFGAIIGRHANRIAGAEVTINGKSYPLDPNDNGKNNLHSNPNGYHKRKWEAEALEGENGPSVTFSIFSPDGDQGYPGNADVSVTYTVTEDNGILIEYHVVSDQDTIVNLTNHSYFNLNGHNSGTVLDQEVVILADEFTYADQYSIPTGVYTAVDGTPMDFRKAKTIGRDIKESYDELEWAGGYDHNYVLKTQGEMKKTASLFSAASGIQMNVFTDRPGMQFYTANSTYIDGNGKGGAIYPNFCGACFETQDFPDAIHHKNFPSPILKAGDEFISSTLYQFTTR